MQTLAASPPVRVNSTAAGAQRLLALGTSPDGGISAAWSRGASGLGLQRLDSGDGRIGGEVAVSPSSSVQPVDMATASAGVLANGDVVLAYNVPRPSGTPSEVAVPGVGVYVQRFSSDGTLRTPETRVFPGVVDTLTPLLAYHRPQVVVLSNDDWLVTAEGANAIGSVRRRMDNTAAPAAGVVDMPTGIWAPLFSYAADAHGGFTAHMAESRFTGRSDISNDGNFYDVTSYDASETPHSLAQGSGFSGSSTPVSAPAALLRLRNAFALVMRDWGTASAGRPYAASLRLLDASGQGEVARADLPFVPPRGEAHVLELADGSFVVGAVAADGQWTMQRFDANGHAMGNLLTAATGGTVPMLKALSAGGFVIGWTAGGADVFTQRFVPAP